MCFLTYRDISIITICNLLVFEGQTAARRGGGGGGGGGGRIVRNRVEGMGERPT